MSQLDRRQLLQASGASVAALILSPVVFAEEKEKKVGFTLPALPYAVEALEPTIDAKTMTIHHGLHHKAYVDNANKLRAGQPKMLAMTPEAILADTSAIPEKIRQGVINNVGGHANHVLFWEIMSPKGGGEPKGELGKAIDAKFESFAKFQAAIVDAGLTQFGSGWAWLVVNTKGDLEITKTPNQESPIQKGLKPILGVDVWEHAYYLKYQNKRKDYLEAWWKVVSWEAVAAKYAAAKK
jgi:Fe-Mn family superoxide dismutase